MTDKEKNTDTIENITTETTTFAKFWSRTSTAMLFLIALGQWNDTKEVVMTAYEEIVSRWTNNVQYEKLEKLRIGYSESYIQTFLGEPQVIKPISSLKGGVFSYYSTPKYLLTTATKNSQLLGFSILAINDDFLSPIVYLDKKLNGATLDTYLPNSYRYVSDSGNSVYFFELSELDRKNMFYDFSIGTLQVLPLTEVVTNKIQNLNEELDRGNEPLLKTVGISNLIKPNYYSVSELSSEIMHEGILSKYEMKALFTYK